MKKLLAVLSVLVLVGCSSSDIRIVAKVHHVPETSLSKEYWLIYWYPPDYTTWMGQPHCFRWMEPYWGETLRPWDSIQLAHSFWTGDNITLLGSRHPDWKRP